MNNSGEITVFTHVSGVLPVETDATTHVEGHIDEGSSLQQFIQESPHYGTTMSHQSEQFMNFMTQARTTASAPIVKPKIDLIHANTAGDSGWEDSNYDFDPSGDNNMPDFGLALVQQVIITGSRLLPQWWTFLDQYQPNAPSSGMTPCVGGVANKIDWGFISQREGLETQDMAVPRDTDGVTALGHSGPTIASGFDVGNHSASDIQNMGLSADLTAKLTPYTSMQKQPAIDYVASHPLHLGIDEVRSIDAASHAKALAGIVTLYDNAIGHQGAFFSLAEEAQTVIASVAFQYGNLAEKTPTFWAEVIANKWTDAVATLRNFNDATPSRRNIEANWLNAGLIFGHVVDNLQC